MICTEVEVKIEYYDLTNEDTRKQLINMGFVAKVKSND